VDLHEFFDLTCHGADTFVGVGPRYPWGGLYGGHIVAQALRAAATTVDADLEAHSLRAYFIRRGDHDEPVRYEVDRIRNGRSFATRRVVARQAVGAILNLEASFQRAEDSPGVTTVSLPDGLPGPDELPGSSWSAAFDRRFVPDGRVPADARTGAGRSMAWLRTTEDLGDDHLLHRCAFAYLSDDLPTDAVIRVHPVAKEQRAASAESGEWNFFSASLDHTIWFHLPFRADRWHLHDFSCHGYHGSRGLSLGHIFDEDGRHVATVAQEVLVRSARSSDAAR
jgi:acyl-CoA thioesterase-2